jgi:hypothetical protein
MSSPIVVITAIEAAFGLLLNSVNLYLVLSKGRKTYHYLFAVLLSTYFIWDLTIFLSMIRNEYVNELPIYGMITIVPGIAIQTLIYHFTVVYLKKPIKWSIILVWVITGLSVLLVLLGVVFQINGVHSYSWGNIFAVESSGLLDLLVILLWFGMILPACWFLYRHSKTTRKALERRHARYIMAGFLVTAFAVVKVGVVMGINLPVLLPLGMLLVDVFSIIIGLAIIKEKLFDITIIVKKGTLYSILAAILIFGFSFSEHVLITYFGKLIGGHSEVVHLVSIAAGIALLMPFKHRIEHGIEKYFAKKKLEF